MRMLLLTPAELSRDPRARRAAAAARARGFEVVGLCGRISGEEPVPLPGMRVVRVGPMGRASGAWELAAGGSEPALKRELRGLYRLGRLLVRTLRFWRAGRTLGGADVVHANDLATLPAGWLLARSARLVYDAHELYSDFEPDPPRVYRAVTSALERALARRADAVVTVSDPLAGELVDRLRLRTPPLVVLNAPELVETEPPRPAEGPLRAIYQGAFGSGRPLGDLVEAARMAPNVHFTIRVVRMPAETVRAEIEAQGLTGRVDVAEPVPPTELVAGLRGFDVGLIFDRPVTRNSELSAPNKLFEYLMAGLAVAAPRLPGLLDLVDGVGVTFEPGRPASLAAVLEELAADRKRLETLRNAARAAAVERFNAERQTAALATAWGL
jgi:glycosyltransferase involved in cell wall biosynthesis